MMMTTGADFFEDIFPFLENEVMFTGPDEGLESVFEDLKKEAGEMFPTRDVTSAINYQRLLGELTRSIILSPKKWRNRIIYPKIFDRVFCILIDESDFTITSGEPEESSEGMELVGPAVAPWVNSFGETMYEDAGANQDTTTISLKEDNLKDPTYYQFYATVSLHHDVDDTEQESSLPTYAVTEAAPIDSAILDSAFRLPSGVGFAGS